MRRWAMVIAVLMASALLPGAPACADGATLRTVAAGRGIKIGTAVDAGALTGDSRYRDKLRYEFNSVTAENVMKWARLEGAADGRYDWTAADNLVGTAETFGQSVRGHTLAWHRSGPLWTADLPPAELEVAMIDHVTETMSRYAGRVGVWDVVNEPMAEDGTLRTYWRQFPPDAIARVFQAARAADPSAKLYLNDFNVEYDNAKTDGYYALAAELKARGLLDGVGFQAHFSTKVNKAGSFGSVLQRFADLGLDVAVTELDVRVPLPPTPADLAAQELLFRRATNACLAVSRCVSLTVWGFTDAYSWVTGAEGMATLYDDAIEEKATYRAVHSALATRDFDTLAVAAHSGKCLHVRNGSVAAGAQLQQYTCTGSASQVFHFERLDIRTYRVTNAANGLCLTVADGSSGDAANVVQQTCAPGSAAQTFVLRPVLGGTERQYQIVAQHSGKCLDVFAANRTNSGWVEQWVCHPDPLTVGNQVWTVTWGHL